MTVEVIVKGQEAVIFIFLSEFCRNQRDSK